MTHIPALMVFSCPVVSVYATPMDCSTPGLSVPHRLPKFPQVHVHCIGDAIQPSHPLTSSHLLSIFRSIRDFSNEPAVHIRWPKYWSFSFSISPSSKYLGLISLKIDWFGHLAVQGTFRSLILGRCLRAKYVVQMREGLKNFRMFPSWSISILWLWIFWFSDKHLKIIMYIFNTAYFSGFSASMCFTLLSQQK